ncbi:MAG: tripartite tricarboxylate transporter substrate binding protein [Betaproteobacteria bacterium]
MNLLKIFAILILHFFCVNARSQTSNDFPQHPIKLIVPFPPAGATDAMSRLLAQKLTEMWNQPVVVENKAGATGAVGSVFVAKAPADGYTLLMGTGTTHSVAPAINPNLPYNNIKDFSPVSLVATFPNLLVVHPSLPVKTVAELITYLKANPGKINFSSTGNGGSVHLAAELFKQSTKTEMTHIPYKGSGEAINDLLSGQVQLTIDNISTVLPHVQTGKLRALGVSSLERSPMAPEIPSISESIPGFEANTWVGLFAPSGTPTHIVQKISTDSQLALKQTAIVQKFRTMGAVSTGNQPEQFSSFIKKDMDRWKNLVQSAGLKLD